MLSIQSFKSHYEMRKTGTTFLNPFYLLADSSLVTLGDLLASFFPNHEGILTIWRQAQPGINTTSSYYILKVFPLNILLTCTFCCFNHYLTDNVFPTTYARNYTKHQYILAEMSLQINSKFSC